METDTVNATGSPDFVAMRSPASHNNNGVPPPIGSSQSAFTFGSTAALNASATNITSSQASMSTMDMSAPVKKPTTATSPSSSCAGASRTSIILTTLLVLSTLLIIAGAILPTVVNKILSDRINDAVQVNPSTMSSKSWATFQNDSLPSAWIVYNVTNLRDVLLTGTVVPNTVPIRVSTAKWVPKYNISFSADGNFVSYHEPHFYEPTDDALALLDQYVTVVNPVYLGAMAQVNRQLQAAATPGAVKGQVDDIDEVTFYSAALSASMLPPFYAQLLNANSTLISALRFFAVPVYMQSCFSVLNATAGLSQSRVVALWTRNDNSTTLPVPCNDMILPAQLNLTTAAALLNTATANSLTGRAGLLAWMNALSVKTPAAIAPLLVNGLTSTDFQNVALWLSTVMFTDAFRSVAVDIGFRTTLGALVPAGSTFNDLGFLQFGSGSIVTVLTAGATSTVVDVIGASAGYLASVNVRKAAEIRVGAIDYCSRAEYASLIICRSMTAATAPYLTIAQTRDFFTFASGQTPNVVTLSRVLAAWFTAANASSVTMAQAFVPFNASASATVRAIISRPFFGTNGANADLLCAYVNAYIPHVFTGYMSEMNEFGVTPANSGLFVRLTLREALFGVSAIGTTKTTAIAQWSPILDGPQVPAANKSWTQLANEYMTANVGRTTTIYTCQDSRDNCGKVVTYFGSLGFRQSCEINDPASLNECAPTSTTRAYNNYTMWNGYEMINGTNTIFATPPLKSDSDALQIATIYVNDVRRTVELPINGEKPKVKGIETRRYQVDSRYFYTNINGYNATTNPMRDTYRYMTADAPDGFVHTFAARGGVPLAVCLPRYNQAPSVERAKLTGFTSDPLEDITFLDVEPISGKSFRGARRLQANMLLRKKNFNALNAMHANLFKAVGGSHVYMPYYYMDETKVVSDEDASDFKDQVIFAIDLSRALQIAFLVIGCVLFVLSAASLHVVRKREAAAKGGADWGGGKSLNSKSALELQGVPASTV